MTRNAWNACQPGSFRISSLGTRESYDRFVKTYVSLIYGTSTLRNNRSA
jgi:hypothetical protein